MIVNLETRELTPDITAMTLTGRLILGNRLSEVEHAIRRCIEQGVRKLVLDLSGLNYIDSAGLGVIAVCIGVMEQQGGKAVIAGVAGQVQRTAGTREDDDASNRKYVRSTLPGRGRVPEAPV